MSAHDDAIYQKAKREGLHLLSKDDDMRVLVERHGYPPKLVHVRLGNVSTSQIAEALRARRTSILDFVRRSSGGVMTIAR